MAPDGSTPGVADGQDDWYVASIDEVRRAAAQLHAAVDHMVTRLLDARELRLEGIELPEIVRRLMAGGGLEARRGASRAFDQLLEAVATYRAHTIKAMVDDDHMTFTEIARIVGVSRQMVARLYQTASTVR